MEELLATVEAQAPDIMKQVSAWVCLRATDSVRPGSPFAHNQRRARCCLFVFVSPQGDDAPASLEPLDTTIYLELERARASGSSDGKPVDEATHVRNKLVFDAVNEILEELHPSYFHDKSPATGGGAIVTDGSAPSVPAVIPDYARSGPRALRAALPPPSRADVRRIVAARLRTLAGDPNATPTPTSKPSRTLSPPPSPAAGSGGGAGGGAGAGSPHPASSTAHAHTPHSRRRGSRAAPPPPLPPGAPPDVDALLRQQAREVEEAWRDCDADYLSAQWEVADSMLSACLDDTAAEVMRIAAIKEARRKQS